MLLAEILARNADVLCLNEVDHFDFFSEHLTKHGYKGIWEKRHHHDGVCLFWKESIFSFLSSTVVRLNTNYGMVRSFPHVGLYVFLGFEGHEICFVVTHLKSGPTSESVRVSQTALLLEGLQKVTAGKDNIPIIMCGDFNSVPDNNVYDFVTTGSLKQAEFGVKKGLIDWIASPNIADFNHPFQFQSAYSLYKHAARTTFAQHDPPSGNYLLLNQGLPATVKEECPYTLYIQWGPLHWKSVIDYIFFTPASLSVVSLLSIPKEEDLPDYLPCRNHPSDHLSIMAEFQLLL